MQLQGGHVYWVNRGDIDRATGSLRRVPRHGGRVETLADGLQLPSALAVDGEAAYLVSLRDGSLHRIVLADGSRELVATGVRSEGVALAGERVYWTDRVLGEVRMRSKRGGPVVTLLSGRNYPNEIVAEPSGPTWLEPGTLSGHNGELWQLAERGPQRVRGQLDFPHGLRGDRDGFFWVDGQGLAFWERDVAMTYLTAPGAETPLASDPVYLYYFRFQGDGADLMRVPKHGGGDENRIAHTDWPAALAVDDQALYWFSMRDPSASDGTLRRLPR